MRGLKGKVARVVDLQARRLHLGEVNQRHLVATVDRREHVGLVNARNHGEAASDEVPSGESVRRPVI